MKTFEELKKDGILKDHNISTYQQVQELFESGEKRVGVVQATGTGKSYLSMQWLFDTVLSQPGKHALVLDPLKGIVKQFKELSEKLCRQKGISPYDIPITFARYDQLKTLTDEEIKLLDYDYIVIDEFHGLGAEGRGTVTQKLLDANPNAKILGVTATPVRYLDKNRDMGDELFGDNIVRGVNLREAIEQEILPQPDYVMAVYSYSETISMIEDKIKRVKDKTQRELFEKELAKAKQRAETAEGLSEVFARKIQNKSGKFIAFCSDIARMESLKEEIHNGLLAGVNKKVKVYKISYKDMSDNSNKIIKQFEEDKDEGCLKVMLAVDMFNEGIHIKDVDGCFMFRPTISPRIYMQQIGRVLNVRDNPDFHPVIFDVVNNIQCLDKIKQAFADEVTGKNGGGFAGIDVFDDLPFKIDGNDIELNDFLARLDNAVSEQTTSKEQWLAAAERYVKEFGNLDVPQTYIEEKTELKLGSWISVTRINYNKNPILVKNEIVEVLTSLDKNWAQYTCEYALKERDKKIIAGVKAWPKDKTISQRAMSPVDKTFPLGMHLSLARRGNSSYSAELKNTINEINPNIFKTQENLLNERDKETICLMKMYVEEYGQVPVPSRNSKAIDKKYRHLQAQVTKIKEYKSGKGTSKYKKDFIEALLEINPKALNTRMDKNQERDKETLLLMKMYVEEYGQVPVPSHSQMLDKKYKHLMVQCAAIRKFISGQKEISYDVEFVNELFEINPNAIKTFKSSNQLRDEKIIEGLMALPRNKPVPVHAMSPMDPTFPEGMHLARMRRQKNGKGRDSYPQKLFDEVEAINPFALITPEEKKNEQEAK